MNSGSLWLSICLLVSVPAHSDGWDVTEARGQTRQIEFTTNAGSWMSVDVSPDGRWIAFDLLGHIYRVPVSGGTAECLTHDSGISVNFQPRFSPDGERIAFISERGGYNNLWIMSEDGTNARPVLHESDVLVSEAVWSADGRTLVAKRASTRSVGSHMNSSLGLWRYTLDGAEPVQLTSPEERSVGGPSYSSNGEYLYYHHYVGDNPREIDLTQADYQVARLRLPDGPGGRVTVRGGLNPVVSPDGRWVAFARRLPDTVMIHARHRYGPRNTLWLLDLEKGVERLVMDPIDPDIADGGNINGAVPYLMPGYDWTPDSKSIIIAQGGKIRRLNIENGRVATVPFEAHVSRTISEQATAEVTISDSPLALRALQNVHSSANGELLIFQALGRVWIVDKGKGKPKRATPESFEPREFTPALSPNGRWIAFISWDETKRGHVWIVSTIDGALRRLSAESGEYIHPMWSRDGQSLIVVRGWGATAKGGTWNDNPEHELMRLSLDGQATVLASLKPRIAGIAAPIPGPEERIYFPEDVRRDFEPQTRLASVAPDGSDRRIHTTLPYATRIAPSPNGQWVAVEKRSRIYVAPLADSEGGNDPTTVDSDAIPGTRFEQISRGPGRDPYWLDDEQLAFGTGSGHTVYNLAAGEGDHGDIDMAVPRHRAHGRVAVTGARIITMGPRGIVESGTILIEDGRILCVGDCTTEDVDHSIDATGSTVMPGIVDMHGRLVHEYADLVTPDNGSARAYLPYGVTTIFAPSSPARFIYPLAEMIEVGAMTGPRILAAADYFRRDSNARTQFVEIDTLDTAEEEARINAALGAVALKNLTHRNAAGRQRLAQAARDNGLAIAGHLEMGSLSYGLSLAMEGYTGVQHVFAQVPLYSDVARFFAQANFTFNPTLGIMGAVQNNGYFIQQSEYWRNEKIKRFFPQRILDQYGTRQRQLRPLSDYPFPLQAEVLKDVVYEGGHATVASHGAAFAAHWEIRMLATALSPQEALKAATLEGARFLGLQNDLGSIEVGKLADLVVLSADPIEDIRNTLAISYVLKSGIIYDGDTSDQLWPDSSRSPLYQ